MVGIESYTANQFAEYTAEPEGHHLIPANQINFVSYSPQFEASKELGSQRMSCDPQECHADPASSLLVTFVLTYDLSNSLLERWL